MWRKSASAPGICNCPSSSYAHVASSLTVVLTGAVTTGYCWIVIDDYLGGADKSGKLRMQVDQLVSAGRLEPLGFYGFGTWIGRWLIDTL